MCPRSIRRREPLIPVHEPWMAVEDGCGLWIVVREDDRTVQPLLDPDPYARCLAVHLAARSQSMRAFCKAVLPRLERTGWADSDRRYRHLCDFGWAASATSPVGETMARMLPRSGLLELPLGAEQALDRSAERVHLEGVHAELLRRKASRP